MNMEIEKIKSMKEEILALDNYPIADNYYVRTIEKATLLVNKSWQFREETSELWVAVSKERKKGKIPFEIINKWIEDGFKILSSSEVYFSIGDREVPYYVLKTAFNSDNYVIKTKLLKYCSMENDSKKFILESLESKALELKIEAVKALSNSSIPLDIIKKYLLCKTDEIAYEMAKACGKTDLPLPFIRSIIAKCESSCGHDYAQIIECKIMEFFINKDDTGFVLESGLNSRYSTVQQCALDMASEEFLDKINSNIRRPLPSKDGAKFAIAYHYRGYPDEKDIAYAKEYGKFFNSAESAELYSKKSFTMMVLL